MSPSPAPAPALRGPHSPPRRADAIADAIVIGAGIVGAACAHALAATGRDVLVLDAGWPAATAAGMGHLVLMDDNPAELALSQASLQRWHDWGPQMPADCGFRRCGTLWLAANEAEMQAAHSKMQVLHKHAVACQMLDAQALAAAEPALHPGLHGALLVEDDGQLYAPNAARWLLAHAARPVTQETAQVTALAPGRVGLADGQWRSAPVVVLAAGLPAQQLCPELPLRAKKGHIAITERGSGAQLGSVQHALVELGYTSSAHSNSGSSVAFNVQQRPTGQLLIGSSRQFDSCDPAVEPAVLARMLRRCLDYLPGLAQHTVLRSWTGFRATTPDGLPIIGPHPQRPGLWLAVGHEGLGVTCAPATAALLAAQICGSALPPGLDPAPYRAQRFAELA